MKTERLHYDDPLSLSFEAEVIAHGEHGGRPSVILDRSAFYPESGGQMADRGTIDGQVVLDVQLEDGRVHHVLEAQLPITLGGNPPQTPPLIATPRSASLRSVIAIGTRVVGQIDGARRREHMALHTGQHALSRALLDELSAVTVSSRLGESACTIDVDRDGVSAADVRAAEEKVNALIDEDRPVRQYFPSDAELERLSLRKPPPDTDRVRVVAIEGWDVTPCGGTHVTHTAQIEIVWVQNVERYKGGTRITFAAGPRARRFLRAESDALRAVARQLACAPPEVIAIVEGLGRKLDTAREEVGALRAKLAEAWAQRLRADDPVIAVLDGADASLLKAVAERLEDRTLVALSAPHPEGTDVLIARAAHGDTHCGELLKKIAAACGGRGGGRPAHAQGRLPSGVDFVRLVRDALH